MVFGGTFNSRNYIYFAYMKKQPRLRISFAISQSIILFMIVVMALFNLKLGALNFHWDDVITALLHPHSTSIATLTIIQVKLPMVILAILAGSGLAISGLLLQ